ERWICRRVRRAELKPFRFRTSGVSGNADRSRAVAGGIGQINRRFESWYEPLVTVCRRIGETSEGGRVFQDSTDEKQSRLAQASITIAREQRFPVFPERNVGVHARAVIGEERFRHERGRFVVFPRDVANDVFVILHRVAHHFQRREADVDLGLAGGGHFVMWFIDRDACFLQFERHLVPNILQRIHRPNVKITFLCSKLVIRSTMVQMSERVGSALKMSIHAVSGSGTTSMSEALITFQPRMLEPSNPSPSVKMSSL